MKHRPDRAARVLFDRVAAAVILAVTSPLFVLVAAAVRIFDGRPVLFTQTRIGHRGRRFRMFKFRTMRVDSDPYMRKPDDDDPVVTPLGRLLRGRALDELPQLWNVVRGDMALVGPRPEMPFVVEQYGDVERTRLKARPGLTGLWQLSRVRDRAIEHHMEYDLFYVANRTLGMDLWLLWRTAVFAVAGRATKIRLAVARWERDPSWRRLVPERSKAIPRRRGRRLSARWAAAGAALAAVVVLPSVGMALLARGELDAARDSLLGAEASLREGDVEGTRAAFEKAEAAIGRAQRRLGSWVAAPGRRIPGLAGNFRVASVLAATGATLVGAGKEGLPVLEALPLREGRLVPPLADGVVDLAALERAAAPAARIREHLARAERTVRRTGGALLLPQVVRARQQALRLLDDARRQADVASGAAFLIPRMLGAEGRRTWVIGAENTAELRGRGGYIGAMGILEAEGGRIRLGDFFDAVDLPLPVPEGTPADIPAEYAAHYRRMGGLGAWQNLTMSPNFPSGARTLLTRLEAAGKPPAQGIISLDPTALAYLLDVTGPVRVPGVPEELTAGNVVAWTLNRLYIEYERDNTQRKDVLAAVAQAVWQRLVDAGGLDPGRLAEALGRAIAERHLVVYSSDPQEQALIERLGLGGEVSRAPGDYLLVFGQNMGENKMDYYVKRTIGYSARVHPDGSLDARLVVTVRNTAPGGGTLPGYIAGPRPRLGLEHGVARTYLGAMVPAGAGLRDASVGGEFVHNLDNRRELGRRLFGVPLDVAPGESKTVVLEYSVADVLVDGRYDLTIQNQSTVNPDDVRVDVDIPRSARGGRRAGFATGADLRWAGAAGARTRLVADVHTPLRSRVAARIVGLIKKPLVQLAG